MDRLLYADLTKSSSRHNILLPLFPDQERKLGRTVFVCFFLSGRLIVFISSPKHNKTAWNNFNALFSRWELCKGQPSKVFWNILISSFSLSVFPLLCWQNLFLLQIFTLFSFSDFLLLCKQYFPSPNIFLLFLLRFSISCQTAINHLGWVLHINGKCLRIWELGRWCVWRRMITPGI